MSALSCSEGCPARRGGVPISQTTLEPFGFVPAISEATLEPFGSIPAISETARNR
jgi:hypothetical protein